MSLSTRLAQVQSKNQSSTVMYSAAGAQFQEWALSILDFKGSPAHQSIGRLVTAINSKQITIGQAENEYLALRQS